MKKLSLLLLFPTLCLAQIPEYYNTIDFSQSGQNLKNQLATLITDTHTHELEYTPEVWDALKQADLDPDSPGDVFLIYGYNDEDASDDNDRTRDKDLSCHNTSCTGKWVREHIYPRSLGTPNLEYEGPGSDAHHLRAIDYDMNEDRSNKRYADGVGHSAIVTNGFYPGDEWKGDIARMIMYMYVRYGTRCRATSVGAGSSSYSSEMPNIFLEWNTEDPVSQYEMNRNNILEEMQGNRNPFIDNPYLATLIWTGPSAQNNWEELDIETPDYHQMVSISPTLTSGLISVEGEDNYTCEVFNSLGQKVNVEQNKNTLDISQNVQGVYFLTIEYDNIKQLFKVVLTN